MFGDAISPRVATALSPPEPSPKSPNLAPPSSGFPTFGRSATLVPATSAFRNTAPASAQARPSAATAPGADWGVRNQQEGADKEGAQQQGYIGKISDMIFGW